MIFVVSTGRSGTKSLAAFFEADPGFEGLHEPEPLLMDEIVGTLAGERDPALLVDALRASRGRASAPGVTTVESNHVLSLVVPHLREAVPDSRLIHLIRDGRDVVASLQGRHTFTNQAREDRPGAWLVTRFRMDWFGWTEEAWFALTAFEKSCWYWEHVNAVLERDLARLPASEVCFIRLEDLWEAPASLANFVGAPAMRGRKPPQINQQRIRSEGWDAWDDDERAAFTRICGARMDRLYPEWRDTSGVWKVIDARPWRTRARVRAQGWARGVIFGRSGPAAWARKLVRKTVPVKLRRRGKRALGV